jgi:phosphoglycolate phosphatase-like HAD superfamily hydrolase
LATTCQPDELKVYLDKLGIDSLIDGIACGTDVKHGKPHPDLFELGLRRLCCDAPSSLTLGDSPYDANAACLARLEPFGVETGGFSRDALREAGCSRSVQGYQRFSGAVRTLAVQTEMIRDIGPELSLCWLVLPMRLRGCASRA